MKQLFLTLGAPAVGKTTWIKEKGYENITLSPDTIRQLLIPKKYSVDEDTDKLERVYNDDYEGEVWNTLYAMVRSRMNHGEDILLDATFLFRHAFKPALDLAKEFNYTIRAIDFMKPMIEDYPTHDELVEELVRRDTNRATQEGRLPIPRETLSYKVQYYHKIKNVNMVKFVSPDEVRLDVPVLDFDEEGYDRVKIIGDIHSDYSNLEHIFDDHQKGTAYVFVGDYLDRGTKPVETFKFLQSLKGHNIYMLQGNHEKHMFNYGRGHSFGGTFKTQSLPALDEAGITRKDFTEFVNRLGVALKFKFQGLTYIVSHAGIEPYIVDNNLDVNAEKYIMEYNSLTNSMYERDIDKAYAEYNADLPINVHGHRNEFNKDIITEDHNTSINLNNIHNKFRWVVLEEGGITTHETDRIDIPNPVDEMFADPDVRSEPTQVAEDIFAHNFTKEVFRSTHGTKENRWTPRTLKARGFFTRGDEVVGRAFNKFFTIGETPDSTLDNLTYPVNVYKKYNGFLAIAFWDTKDNKVRFVTKSGRATFSNGHTEITLNLDDMTIRQEELLNPSLDTITDVTKYMTYYFKQYPHTSVLFEALYDEDEHVVPEKLRQGHTIIPIAVVNNEDGTFNAQGEKHFRVEANIEAKDLSKAELEKFLQDNTSGFKEGYVIRDTKNKMMKYKTPYYLKAKEVRGRLEQYNHLGAKKFTEAGGYNQLKYYHDGLDWVQKLIKAGVTTYNPKTIDDMFHEEMY